MKNLKFRQCLAALFLSSMFLCTVAGCNKDKPVESTSTTVEETESSEEEDDDDWDDEDWEETEEDIDQILADNGFTRVETEDGFEITSDDGFTLIIETGESELTNNLGPYVYDGDFNHSELDDFAQECAHNGWPIEVLSASDLGLKDSEFAEGFVAYDINECPHYYLFYKDAETAYDNLVDHIVGEGASISKIANITAYDAYSVDFDTNDHTMDVEIYDDGFAIFDDKEATIVTHDTSSSSYPTNKDYKTAEISALAEQYFDKGYQLFDINNNFYEFKYAVEGFTGSYIEWPEDSDFPTNDLEVYVLKFESKDDAFAEIKNLFYVDATVEDKSASPLVLSFNSGFTSYTGTLSDDGLLILKGSSEW